MDLFEAITTRRSIRSFTGAPVACADLEKIVNAGRLAASGMNAQPWEFIVITEPEVLHRLNVPEDHWSRGASAMIAIVMDTSSRWWMEDAAAAAQNMLLACTALGYGACWIEGYTLRNAENFSQALCIPSNRKLFTLIAIGVPSGPVEKEKKGLDEVIYWQQYGGKQKA